MSKNHPNEEQMDQEVDKFHALCKRLGFASGVVLVSHEEIDKGHLVVASGDTDNLDEEAERVYVRALFKSIEACVSSLDPKQLLALKLTQDIILGEVQDDCNNEY